MTSNHMNKYLLGTNNCKEHRTMHKYSNFELQTSVMIRLLKNMPQ